MSEHIWHKWETERVGATILSELAAAGCPAPSAVSTTDGVSVVLSFAEHPTAAELTSIGVVLDAHDPAETYAEAAYAALAEEMGL